MEVVAFRTQQAAEKYLYSLLTRHQIEFPKTHELRRLASLLVDAQPAVTGHLDGLKWLEPFGVEIRYPSDGPDTLPGDAEKALGIVGALRKSVLDEFSS